MNRHALYVFVARPPARLHFAKSSDGRARRALIEWMSKMIELGEAVQ